MVLNLDPIKQAQEVLLSRKSHSLKYLDLYINILAVKTQKQLELKLDETLNFRKHLKDNLAIVNKGIRMLKKLSHYLPRNSLVTLYKAFIRPHLDDADIIYDKPNNMNIFNEIEILQYNGVLAIIGAIRGSSKEKLNQELGSEYLSSRRWLLKLCLFYKTVVNKSPNYLYIYVSTVNQPYQTRSGDKFLYISCRTEYFANFLFAQNQ